MKKKVLLTFLIAVLCISAISLTNIVNAASNTAIYGTVEAETGNTGEVVKDEDNGTYTVTFTSTQINERKWVGHDDGGIERGKNGWWLGFKVTAPTDADVEKSTWKNNSQGGIFKNVVDSDGEKVCTYWVCVDQNKLDAHDAKWLEDTYVFEWIKTTGEPVGTLTVKVEIDPSSVTLDPTPEFKDSGVENPVKVTIGGHIFTLAKGDTLADLGEKDKEILASLKTKEGYTFVRFVNEAGEEVTEETPIDSDVTLTPEFVAVEQPKEEEQKDDTPKTGSINVELVAGLIAVISLAGIVFVKKYNK